MDAASWFRERGTSVPAALRERIREALDAAPPTAAAPTGLAEAALDRLRRAVDARGTRAAAVDLLAADALLTFACEAAAERGPDALAALVERYDPGQFARLADVSGPRRDGGAPSAGGR